MMLNCDVLPVCAKKKKKTNTTNLIIDISLKIKENIFVFHFSVCCAGDVCFLGLEMCLLLCDGGALAIRPHFGISIIDSAGTLGAEASPHSQVRAGCGQLFDSLQSHSYDNKQCVCV